MALHSKTEAAKMAGVSRATIHRKVSNGLLSAESGMIETSELLRIYPNSKLPNDDSSATPNATLVLEHEKAILELKLKAAEVRIEAQVKTIEVLENSTRLLEHQKTPPPDNKSLKVVQSNDLIEARYKMTLNAKRVLMCLIAKIDARKPMPKKVHLDANEFTEFTGIDLKNAYRGMKAGVDELTTVRIRAYDRKTRSGNIKVLAHYAEYNDGDGTIECAFSPYMEPHIHYLSENFTQYELIDPVKFRSFYAIRLYELLMQWKSTGSRIIKLADYRDAMGLEDGQYRVFDNLRRRTIDIAVNEINDRTRWTVSYQKLRKGRKIHALEFTFEE